MVCAFETETVPVCCVTVQSKAATRSAAVQAKAPSVVVSVIPPVVEALIAFKSATFGAFETVTAPVYSAANVPERAALTSATVPLNATSYLCSVISPVVVSLIVFNSAVSCVSEAVALPVY